jgi:hypothetical protein
LSHACRMELLITQFSPASYYFPPSPHQVQSTLSLFFLPCERASFTPIQNSSHHFNFLCVNLYVIVDRYTRFWTQWWLTFPKFNLPLTLWRRNFLLNFSTPVHKMWIIQEPKKVALWNKRHFEEEKVESVQQV